MPPCCLPGVRCSEERDIEISLKKKKKAGDLHFKDSIPLLSPGRKVGVPIWAVTAAGLREATLSNSKVEWKQILHYNCAHALGCSGCTGGTSDVRQAAQRSPASLFNLSRDRIFTFRIEEYIFSKY